MVIDNIIRAIKTDCFLVTDHADEEAVNDRLSLDQIISSVKNGEILEDYPIDKPYPSCLILGFTVAGDPVHSVWAYNEQTSWAVLITVYRPDPKRWVNWQKRRKK